MENPERGRRIAEIQKLIQAEIAINVSQEIERKVKEILESDQPHTEIFKLRRTKGEIM